MIAEREQAERKAGKKSKDPNNWMYNMFIGSFVCMVLLDRYGRDLGIPLDFSGLVGGGSATGSVKLSPDL
jgi:hypothetical protein